MANLKQQTKSVEEEEETELDGDILELVLSKVHLIHPVPARQVSKSWNRAASSSMRRRLSATKLKPWLVIHSQTTRFPYRISARAFDPASQVWLDIAQNHHHPSDHHRVSTLRSSHSTLLYMLSSTDFAFSIDAFHLEWHHAAPRVWRVDPIVGKIGHLVVLAGVAVYEDDPPAMEMYDVKLGTWDTCGSMPAVFGDSAASTWLSVASDEMKMYVMEKSTGLTCLFDPETNKWFGPYDLSPEATVYNSMIGFIVGGGLILAGVVGEAEDVKSVKLWVVKSRSNDGSTVLELKEMMGEMPDRMLDKLKRETYFGPSIAMTCMGGLVCLYNTCEPSHVILCEIKNGGECRWSSIKNEGRVDGLKRMVVTFASVGPPELQNAVQVGALKIQ